MSAKCSKKGCDKAGSRRGYCLNHYKQAITSREISPIQPRNLSVGDRLKRYSKHNCATGCIEWTGYRNQDGYGKIQMKDVSVGAHRVAWEQAKGPIPGGMSVLHKCDNPPCINPDHLFLGTQADNVADMHAKKRHSPNLGKTNGRAKLTEDQVRKIRLDGRYQKEIATDYGVNQTLVSMIKRRVAWSHVA